MTTKTGAPISWANWAGNQQSAPIAVAHPRDRDELADLVAVAARAGRRVKPIGAGHSFTGIGRTDGVLVRLDRYADQLAVDARTHRVTVAAGMRLHELNRLLWDHDLSMTNLGDIDVQTISGAISTGTHGTGAKVGGIATQVAALELVLADGSVVSCSPAQRPELFAAARVGLGALGLLSTVTLQCEPAFALHAVEGPMRLAAVLDDLDEHVRDNEHFEFFWFPHTDAVLAKRNNRVPPGTPLEPLPRLKAWLDDEFLSNTVFGLTCRLGRRAPALIPRLNRIAGRALGARTYVERSYQVFASPRSVRFVEMEYAVPRERVTDVLRELRAFIERSGLRVSFPVEVRFAAADDIWLSTAHGRDSAYVAVHMFRGQEWQTYFRGVEAIMNGVAGRPHWGKLHFQDAASLAQRYPRHADFVRLRDEVDPAGVFTNDYLDHVLGPPPAACG